MATGRMMMKHNVLKIKGRGYIQVIKESGNWMNYKVVEFKCVRDINKASLWSKDPRRKNEIKGYFKGITDVEKIEFVEHSSEAECITLDNSPI